LGDAIGYIKQDEIKNGRSQEIWYHTVPKLSLKNVEQEIAQARYFSIDTAGIPSHLSM
jgi:hypothetical protein